MKTRWIDLATAGEILGVSEEEASNMLCYHGVRTRRTMTWRRPGAIHYDALGVEELAKIRDRMKSANIC